MQWNPQRAPVSVLPCAALAGKQYGTFRPTSTAKSRPSVRTFVPNWKAYKLRTHSCWSWLKSTKAQPTGVRVNSTSCSVDRNLTVTAAGPQSTSTQQRKRVRLTRPLPMTKCSKPLVNLLSLKQRSHSRLRHRIHLRPNKSARHRHKSSRGTTRHARKTRHASLPSTRSCTHPPYRRLQPEESGQAQARPEWGYSCTHLPWRYC